ncbi:MAG TPA: hypothetical protein VN325_04430 [Steroidobacteraceae bacterium]|nr:hypothetical protein [Steroidobacteraceae bacterium]
MSLVEIKAAIFKPRPPPDPSTSTCEAGSNVLPFATKPPPTSDETAYADGASQQLNRVANDTVPEAQTDAQKAAEVATQRARDFAAKFDSFRDIEGAFYILHQGDALSLNSTDCVDIFREAAMNIHTRLTKDGLEQLQTMLRTAARAKPAKTANQRSAKDGGSYIVDLGDKGRQVARVDANGITVEKSNGVIFIRGKGYGELPMPVIPRDADEAWDFVQPLLQGIPKHDQIPLIAAKIEHLRPDSPQPILILTGSPGAGKSTLAQHLIMSIDPFEGKMPSVTHSERGIYSAAQGRHSLCLDNLSATLKGDMEDTLCRSSSGGAITVPELYTTADSRNLRLFVAWHITGIANIIRQADTLDRAWVIRVERPKTYRPDDVIRAEFKMAHGQVLGGLLFFLAERMRRAPSIWKTQNVQHRMADFLVTGEALAQAIGQRGGSFIAAVESKRMTAARDWIEGDTFTATLVRSLAEIVKATTPATAPGPWSVWNKSPGYCVFQHQGRVHVVATADAICREVNSRQQVPYGWSDRFSASLPSTARMTVGAIDRVQGQMTRAGWTVAYRLANGGKNHIWLFGVPP